jgi:hypothetical protein
VLAEGNVPSYDLGGKSKCTDVGDEAVRVFGDLAASERSHHADPS